MTPAATILLALVSVGLLLVAHEAQAQDVEIREAQSTGDLDGSASSSSGGGGLSRTIYSQRHLSPHRMMHFGKRPTNAMAPLLNSYSFYEMPAEQRQSVQQQQPDDSPLTLPFVFSIELENGQTIRAVPEADAANSYPGNRNLVYTLPSGGANQLTGFGSGNSAAERRKLLQQQLNGQRLSKLIADQTSDEVSSGNSAERVQQAEQPAINVNTRSPGGASRTNTLSLPKAFVSTLMYGGRQSSAASSSPSSSAAGFGGNSFNKKAEPKDNFFMHFGRK